jgi:hypothetical protein
MVRRVGNAEGEVARDRSARQLKLLLLNFIVYPPD